MHPFFLNSKLKGFICMEKPYLTTVLNYVTPKSKNKPDKPSFHQIICSGLNVLQLISFSSLSKKVTIGKYKLIKPLKIIRDHVP